MKISQRAQEVAPFYAMDFASRAAAVEAQGSPVIRLSIGEPDFGAPPAFLAAAREVSDGRPLTYTGALGLPELREAIADFYRHHFRANGVTAEQVAVTSGASAALLLACAALIDPDDGVLIGDPSYPCNRQFAQAFGARVSLVPTGVSDRFQLTPDAVDAAWSESTRGVIVASPSNPTGTSLPYDELVELCHRVAARGGWSIVDEIYLGLSDPGPDGRPPRSVLADPSVGPDVVVVNSFSKYFGMTGWRLGWCILPPDMVDVVERLAQNFYVCPPTPAQYAALSCFSPESLAVCEDRRREFVSRRQLVLDALTAMGLRVPVIPDGAFYVYIDVSDTGLGSWEFCERALTEAHVALTPGKDFGAATADDHVRLSYAASTADLTEGLRRLASFVEGLAS